MPAKAKKPKAPAIETLEDFVAAIDRFSRLSVKVRSATAARDRELQLVRDRHDQPIENDEAEMKSISKLCSTFAAAHRDRVFSTGLKSGGTALSLYGFRTGNDTLKPLNNRHTWDSVRETLKEQERFLRTVEEIDKDAIHNAGLSETELAAIGLRLDRTERFYIEPKTDDGQRHTVDLDAV